MASPKPTMKKVERKIAIRDILRPVQILEDDVEVQPLQPDIKIDSRITTRWITDGKYSHKFLQGSHVSVDPSSKYIAFWKGEEGSKYKGLICIISTSSENMVMIRGIGRPICELDFIKLQTIEPLLACVDDLGGLYVYEIVPTKDPGSVPNFRTVLVLSVEAPSGGRGVPTPYHRLKWCPVALDDDEDVETMAKWLVVSQNSMLEVWDIQKVIDSYGCGPLDPDEVTDGRIQIAGDGQAILDVQFSPDANAVAAASADGLVRFYSVDFTSDELPEVLCKWTPIEKTPVSSLFFLDGSQGPYWEFVVTGFEGNTLLKVWHAVSWTCLQTIRISYKGNSTATPKLKASLNRFSTVLVLTDINTRMMFLLKIEMVNDKKRFVLVEEFLSPSSILDIDILNVEEDRHLNAVFLHHSGAEYLSLETKLFEEIPAEEIQLPGPDNSFDRTEISSGGEEVAAILAGNLENDTTVPASESMAERRISRLSKELQKHEPKASGDRPTEKTEDTDAVLLSVMDHFTAQQTRLETEIHDMRSEVSGLRGEVKELQICVDALMRAIGDAFTAQREDLATLLQQQVAKSVKREMENAKFEVKKVQ